MPDGLKAKGIKPECPVLQLICNTYQADCLKAACTE